MKTLHFYLVRQVGATLLMTVAVFTFVLLLGNVLKEILALLINRQVTIATVFQVVLLLIPYVLVFSLPMGFLTATLLVFGRMSADQELTAIRASGVSLVALVMPVLVCSILCSGLSAFINLQVAPQCRMQYKMLLKEAGFKSILSFLPEQTYIRDFKGYIVYIHDVDGTNLHDVYVYTLAKDGTLDNYVHSESGQIEVDRQRSLLKVTLNSNWQISMWQGNRNPAWAEVLTMEVQMTDHPIRRESVEEMTITQLFQELRALEATLGGALPLKPPGAEADKRSSRSRRLKPEDGTAPILVQIHRQFSFSFACIGFTLVGIPLGIRSHRRETTFGIAVALLLVFLYYGFFIIGQALESRPEWGPHLILWLPNILFQSVGAVLFWRANQGL